MLAASLPESSIKGLYTLELTSDHTEELQDFFEANPAYFLAVNGEPPSPREAHEEIHGELPEGWSFTKKWLVGYVDEDGKICAMANVISDLLAPGVWHIGLFVLATKRHGTGDAQGLYQGLERWAIFHGASWMRLGIVAGNTRAERFWERLGYIETRRREGVVMGKLTNTIRVMVKALQGGTLEDYRSLIERDRPEAS